MSHSVAARLLSVVGLFLLLFSVAPADAQRRAARRARPAQVAETPPATPPPAEATPPPAIAAPAPAGPTVLVEQGVSAYEEGDFDAALAAFDRAEAAGLDRPLLVRILSHRVLIAHASADVAALESQALRLVSLDPEALRSEASPGLVRALEGARGRADGIVRLRIDHNVVGDQIQLRARVEGDAAGMVRELRLRARRGDGPMVEAIQGVVTLQGTSTSDVVLVADCVGPGDAVLANTGTDAEPYSLASAIAEQIVAGAGDDTALHVGIVLGSIVAVAAVVAITILVVDSSASTAQLSGPVVEW